MAVDNLAEDDRPNLGRDDYQVLLRALGARLDRYNATAVRAIELADGFSVQYVQRDGGDALIVEHLLYEELVPRLSNQLRPLFVRRRQSPALLMSYQDVFRALGYELDQAQAWTVLIEELEDGLLVTYQYLNPVEGYMTRKRLFNPNREETEAMVRNARSRRHQRRKLFALSA